ncbi:MAG: transglutaminase domain protein [Caulobacteraceae bacterium]|nr:transglutaminase domain protein [Caulobacteraceae bacterium]
MMFRPREGYDQRVLSAELFIDPVPTLLRNVHDVFGNCVGIARFGGRSDRLSFESRVTLDHTPAPTFLDVEGELAPYAGGEPFPYAPEDLPDLVRSIERQFPDPDCLVEAWARRFVRRVGPTSLNTLLTEMTRAIHTDFRYGTRLHGAPQTPQETLGLRTGSCRDFAVLMIEAVRSLGLAAGFVSGYVYSSKRAGPARRGGGHTHAWMRVYLPVCGWVEFDPTNGIIGATDLVRVAVARDPRQALPLHGTWAGQAKDYIGMDVEVDVDVAAQESLQPLSGLRLAAAG